MKWLDRDESRLGVCAVSAIALHIGAGAALFVGIGAAAKPTVSPAAQMVVELAEPPSAPPVQPNLAPPELERVKAESTPVRVKLDIPPLPEAVSTAQPAVIVPPMLQAQPNQRQDKPAEETTHAAAAFAPNADDAHAPTTGAPSYSVSKAAQSWESRVLAQLERKKHYPGDARRQHQEDVVVVSIRLDPAGRLIDSSIRQSIGYSLLNAEVMDLVRRASPYPAPPADMIAGRKDVALLVPLEFFLRKGGS